jgi:hypothetical protein
LGGEGPRGFLYLPLYVCLKDPKKMFFTRFR